MKRTIIVLILSNCIYFFGFAQKPDTGCTQCVETSVSGTGASAIGVNTTASNEGAFAGGSGSVATGAHSFSFGENTLAGNSASIALGHASEATGSSSFAAGFEAKSYGDYSTALGIGAWSAGFRSTAIGFNAYSGNINGFALGTQVKSLNQNSFVLGTGPGTNYLENNISNSLKIGFGSTKHTLFVSTAPATDKTGKIGIGDLTDPQAKLHIKTDIGEYATMRLEPWNWSNYNYAEIQFGDEYNTIRGTYETGIGFYTPNDYIFHTGNVGIDKTPTEKLDVNGNIKQSEGYYVGTDKVQAVGENGLRLYNFNQQGIFVSPGGNVAIGTSSALYKLSVNGNIFTGSDAYIAGNTGIGTVTPQEKLHVEGSQYLSGNLTVNGSSNLNGIVLTNDTDISGADEIIGYNDLRLKGDGNGGTDVTITADGKVGIGTGAPGEKLEVNGKTKTTGFQMTTNPGTGKLLQSDASGNASWASPAWTVSGSNVYRSSGNVGIGKANPSVTLELSKNITTSGKVGMLVENQGVFPWFIGMNHDDYEDNIFVIDNYNQMPNGPPAFAIDIYGKVGIGTNTPAAELDVAGKIICGEVEVISLTEWKDKVFDKNYNLRPLEEIEQFIKENGHLPEIPSEKDVLENGISLGEMNALLLQKIEELTLYVIELEKEIKTYKKE